LVLDNKIPVNNDKYYLHYEETFATMKYLFPSSKKEHDSSFTMTHFTFDVVEKRLDNKILSYIPPTMNI
jgi:hypothetical protein